MAVALRIRRCLWVALAAIAASLPGTAGASSGARCETMPADCTVCSCCEGTSTPAASVDPTSAAIVAPPIRGTAGDRLTSSAPRCECRGQEAPAPAQKPGQRAEERRVEKGRDVAAVSPNRPGSRAPAVIAFMPDVGPPRSPIYLRTMRLLF